MDRNKNEISPKISEDKLTIEYDKEKFSDILPNLTNELHKKDTSSTISIETIGFEDQVPQDPDVYDFLQRCSKKHEAREIIDFLEKRGEINQKTAQDLLNKLEKIGLKAFGPHRDHGYYERNFRKNKKFHQL